MDEIAASDTDEATSSELDAKEAYIELERRILAKTKPIMLASPDRRAEAMRTCHDDPIASYLGLVKTLEKL